MKASLLFTLFLLFGLVGLVFAANMGEIPIGWEPHDGVTVEYHGADPRPQICWVDNATVRTAGQPSIRLEAHGMNTSGDPGRCTNLGGNGALCTDANHAREVDGYWIAVFPGDNITISCWIRANQSTLGHDNDTNYGARILFDYYDASYIEINTWDLDTLTGWTSQINYVPFNETDWQFRRTSVIVPAVINDTSGNPRVPSSFVAWIQVMPWQDGGVGWFADPYIEVNGGTPYTLSLNVWTPAGSYTTSTVPVSLSASGTDTVTTYNWNVYNGSAWLFATNHTGTFDTLSIGSNGTYTFCGSVTGVHGSFDYEEKQFIVYYITEPPVTPSNEHDIEPSGNFNIMPIALPLGIIGTFGLMFMKWKR